MPDKFISILDALNTNPELRRVKQIIQSSDVVVRFSEIFPELEKIAVPVKVDRKILFIKVENSVWRNELKFMEQRMVEKINDFFKGQRIKSIKFLF
ncbi:MAG: DUF721 domain-containing protein [Ignavibacteriaceae bacterium]|nr:DUF721 domain-containing protein [Ignavibacteriaceae bacterium]